MVQNTIHELDIKAGGPVDSLIERLAERVGARASATIVYGEPVEREGVTVIPVAKVRWAFGGGGGHNADQNAPSSGSGGGGGMTAAPIGFIEIRAGRAEFKKIDDPTTLLMLVPPVIIAGGITSWLVLRGLRRLIRG